MGKSKVLKINRATSMQSGMLFHSLLHQDGGHYHEQIGFYMEGKVDFPSMQSAWQEVTNRHEVFRTDFRWKESKNPVQIVVDVKEAEITLEDLTYVEEAKQAEYIEQWKAREVKKRFDFERGRLSRLAFLQLAKEKYYASWTFHHILLDGWSIQIVLRDFFQIYHALTHDLPLPLAPTGQFSDYLEWLKKQSSAKGTKFWQEYLQELSTPTLLQEYSGKDEIISESKVLEVALDASEANQIQELCRSLGITLNTFFQTAWGLLLQKYNNTTVSSFGFTVSGRPAAIPGVEEIVGLFINTVPVVIKTENSEVVKDLLRKVNNQLGEIREYEYVSLAEIQALSPVTGPLFDSIYVFENYPIQKDEGGQSDFTIKRDSVHELTNYDLTLAVASSDTVYVKMMYNSKRFSEEQIEQVKRGYLYLVSMMGTNPEKKVTDLSLWSEVEANQFYSELNATLTDYPKDKTLTQLFEEQVSINPDHPALHFKGNVLTYGELNAKANQLANFLRSKISGSQVVGLLTDRSMEMIIGIFGILKAGCAYLPIDPENPEERNRFIIEDSGASLIVLQSHLANRVVFFTGEKIELEGTWQGSSEEEQACSTKATDLAYVIYTSGTTGRPKGNLIQHYNVTRTVKNTNYITLTPGDRVMQLSNYAFDGSVFDIFGALLNGATLVLVPKEILLEPAKLGGFIESEGVTVTFVTTALFNLLADTQLHSLQRLRKILFGGERVSTNHVAKAYEALGPGRLIHVYGPTESTVYATYYPINELLADCVPIGKPIANTQVYVVDGANHLLPPGVAGELCLGGDGLAKGYLHQTALTDEKFVPNPFKPGEKMYRTGDLVRLLTDGSIEFLDRMDTQVKLRGFRIELGEIEKQLLNHPKVKEAVVIDCEDGQGSKYLCAYVVPKAAEKGEDELTAAELRQSLAKNLPDYMIPAHFVQLQSLPLTPNGKVDRRALPKPDGSLASGREYLPPTNEIEAKLAGIWQEILGVERVGCNDNFFEIGGHSLKATQLAARVYQELHVELPLREIFRAANLQELAESIANSGESVYSSIESVAAQEHYPLSSAQKRLFALNQMSGDDISYNIPGVVILEGAIERERFVAAFGKLVERHEAFRTSFTLVNGEPVQRVHPEAELVIEYFTGQEEQVEEIVRTFVRPFDLGTAPLLRVGLIELRPDKYVLIYDLHHIISDGTSMSILASEFAQIYAGQTLSPLRIQYKDFAFWQNRFLQSEEMAKEERFWLDTLSGELPVLNLPTDAPRPKVMSYAGDTHRFALDCELSTQLNELAAAKGVTLYMLLLAAFNVLVSRYSGQEDVIVGTPIAGRPHADLEPIIGMFVNTLAMRNRPTYGKRFKDFLNEVKNESIRAFENQDYQFEMLVEKLDLKRDLSRNPIFDVMFGLQNMSGAELDLAGLKISQYPFTHQISKFDLTLLGSETPEGLHFSLEYSTSLFRRDTVERMAAHLVNVLRDVVANPEIRIADISLLSKEEREQVFIEFNATDVQYPREMTIQQLFAEQVRLTPDKVAVVAENGQLTYQELDQRTNQLAIYLREKGVTSDEPLGIMVDRSLEMIVGVLGIIKAGGAYLPIDVDYPTSRIEYMLKDADVRYLLTTKDVECPGKCEIIYLDDTGIYKGDGRDLPLINKPDDLIYIIYTSGSTGQPKGVMIEHGNVNRLISNSNMLKIRPEERILQTGSLAFDASTFEIWGSLLNGATLYLVSKDTLLSADRLEMVMKEHQISMIWLTSPLFNQLLEENPGIFATLQTLIVGGDALSPKHINQVRHLYPALKVINGYGPTESTTFTTYYTIEGDYIDNIPIGWPVSNTRVYILDRSNHLQPIGIPGELCIAGDGLARGYLKRPELTAEKFVENPLIAGDRMYRTGDLARWLPGGSIEFLGRIDQQVKIRGFRIELGEIENRLLRHPLIKEAVVLDRTNEVGQKYLAAYIVSIEELKVSEVRAFLAQELPDYMIPAYFVSLEKLPLNQNGKIDRQALPKPTGVMETGREYVAPCGEREEALARVWAEVLGLERVGVRDSFFDLGGDSIKAIQIAARLQKHGFKVETRDLFKHPTIEGLALTAERVVLEAEQGIVTGEILLTPIQHWFFTEHNVEIEHFNQSIILYRKEGFDEIYLQQVLQKLVEHHDLLRARYKVTANQLDEQLAGENAQDVRANDVLPQNDLQHGWQRAKSWQVKQYNRSVEGEHFTIKIVDLRNVGMHSLETEILEEVNLLQRSMNLQDGPLVRAALIKTGVGDHLFIAIHHLVVDGVSWRIILEDLAIAYSQAEKGEKIELAPKSDSFKEWASRLNTYASSKESLRELDYWKQIAETEVQPLPKDFAIEKNQRADGRSIALTLSKAETAKLLKEVHHAYNTEINDILLSALTLTISEWANTDTVAVNLESHGREEILSGLNITRTVGWFTTSYPVVFKLRETLGSTLGQRITESGMLVKTVKETMRQIPHKGIGYGVLKYLTEVGARELGESRLQPEISFNYLGQFDQDANTGVFSMSDLPMGEPMSLKGPRQFTLDVTGMVQNGQLTLGISYHRDQFREATVGELAERFKANLLQLVEHCTQKERSEYTPSDLGASTLGLAELARIEEQVMRNGVKLPQDGSHFIQQIDYLTPMQEGMLFHALLTPRSEAYFEQMTLHLTGSIDRLLFMESFNQLIARYDILRTIFVYENLERPRQIVLRERQSEIGYRDLSQLGEKERVQAVEEFKLADRRAGFDLTKNMLMRVALLQTGSSSYELVWSFHHIIMDGWCLSIIIGEMSKIYQSLVKGEKATLGPVYPYSTYLQWLEKQDKEEARIYWKNYLENYEVEASLPTQKLVQGEGYEPGLVSYTFDEAMTAEITAFAVRHQVTVNTIFQSIWGILLQNYLNVDDVVFGTIVSGRPAEVPGVERMVGLFINAIPVRVKSEEGRTFTELLARVQQGAVQSGKYDYFPLVEIQAASVMKQNLLDHLMVFENYPVEEELRKTSAAAELPYQITGMDTFEQTNYDFNILIMPGKELTIRFGYNANVYDNELIERIPGHFAQILETVLQDDNITVEEIDPLTEVEKQQILWNFNATEREFPADRTVADIIEAQVERVPDAVAVEFRDQSLTYRELNAKANQLAYQLQARGVGSETIVGIAADRSLELMVALVAVFKAGGAYLPIYPDYPEERIRYLIEDSGTELVLTQGHLLPKLQDSLLKNGISNPVSSIEEDKENISAFVHVNAEAQVSVQKSMPVLLSLDDDSMYSGFVTNPMRSSGPKNLAYVIYTSGSTGLPKGVMIEQHSLNNFVHTFYNNFDGQFGPGDRCLSLTNISFDVSVLELFLPLMFGATLVLFPSKEVFDVKQLASVMIEKEVTFSFTPPSLLSAVFEELYTRKDEVKLKKFISGVESITDSVYQEFYKLNPTMIINNGYGPTEATIAATFYRYHSTEVKGVNVPIGHPLDNYQVYILGKNDRPVPIGIPGEICISGEGLARGYLNRPELTAEKYIPNPFIPGERIYRTGDRGYWHPDGNIQFIGRIDYQVKIRGYRVEPGEIEVHLVRHPEIENAVVIDRNDTNGTKYLCAYLVAPKTLPVADVRDFLAKLLPEYMIPSYFIYLDQLPLTHHGKVDRRALPEPAEHLQVDREYVAPRTELEEKLCKLWKDTLGLNRVGINDNFFEIGGHSLKATQLVTKIVHELKVELPLREIFTHPTVKELAEYLESASSTSGASERGQDDNLVLLRKGTNDYQHLFIVHAGSGEVEGYIELANRLALPWNPWGVRADRFNDYTPRYLPMEELAKYYLDKLRQVQPHGPYYLAGWCIGGSIAFEMVRQLEEEGEEVAFFGMINATPPHAGLETTMFTFEEERQWVESFVPLPLVKDLLNTVTRVEEIWPTIAHALEASGLEPAMLKAMIPQEIAAAIPNFAELGLREVVYYLSVTRSFTNTRSGYFPAVKIATKAHFFEPTRSQMPNRAVWDEYCIKPVQHYTIEGDHFSIFKIPEVDGLAEVFGGVLDESAAMFMQADKKDIEEREIAAVEE